MRGGLRGRTEDGKGGVRQTSGFGSIGLGSQQHGRYIVHETITIVDRTESKSSGFGFGSRRFDGMRVSHVQLWGVGDDGEQWHEFCQGYNLQVVIIGCRRLLGSDDQ